MVSDEGSVDRWHAVRSALQEERAQPELLDGVGDLVEDEVALLDLGRIIRERTPGWGARGYREWVLADPSLGLVHDFLRRSHREAETPSASAMAADPLGTRGGYYAWTWGYRARAAVYAHQRYQDPRLLEEALAAFRGLLRYRDDRLGLVDDFRGRVVKSWGARYGPPPGSWRRLLRRTIPGMSDTADRARWRGTIAGRGTEITTAAMTILPICELLTYTRRIGFPVDDAADLVERMLETVLEFEDDFRSGPVGGAGYYVNRASSDIEPLNHAAVLGAALVHLHALSGDAALLERAKELDGYFRASWRMEDNGTFSWAYVPRPGRMFGSGEDVWKAAVTIELPLALRSAAVGYSEAEMAAIAAVFTRNVWPDDANVNMRITGRQFKPLQDVPREGISRLAFIASWMRLDRYEPRLRSLLLEAVATRPEWFPYAWLGTGFLARCYALAEPVNDPLDGR